MLIEKDKRDEEIKLAYSKDEFAVPSNLYIIGMMNTADRSLAIIDYALRRRFSFVDITPAFRINTDGKMEYNEKFEEEINKHESEYLKRVMKRLADLNVIISKHPSLGKGFVIGHSYFCDLEDSSDDEIKSILSYDIAPMLREYWYDEESKAEKEIEKLLGD